MQLQTLGLFKLVFYLFILLASLLLHLATLNIL